MIKKKHNKINYKVLGAISVVACLAAMVFLCVGIISSVKGVKEEEIARRPEAVLASAGLSEDKNVFLGVMYYDQKQDECVNLYDTSQSEALSRRQFEWESCGYYNKTIEEGLVNYELGEDYLPEFKAGEILSNRGLADAKRWFSAEEGKSASYAGTLGMQYNPDNAELHFYRDQFYPLDEATFSKSDGVNKDGHNHLFTMNFAVPFTVMADGREKFEITADDDTFVYVGDKLVIDMGGIHDATVGRFEIRQGGEVYASVGDVETAFTGVRLSNNSDSIVRIFHADRDAKESVFGVKLTEMNIAVVDTRLAQGEDGVQVAYDPTDPTYAAPLGKSVEKDRDNTKGYIVLATVEGVMVVMFGMLILMSVRMMLKKKQS